MAFIALMDAQGLGNTIVVTDVTPISTNESYPGLALVRATEAIEIYDRNGNRLHSITAESPTGDKQLMSFKPILICCSDEPKISALTLSGENIVS